MNVRTLLGLIVKTASLLLETEYMPLAYTCPIYPISFLHNCSKATEMLS